jgi:hypothetical protein
MEHVEVRVCGSCKAFRRPVVSPLGLIAGLLLAAPGPVDQGALAEPRNSAPTHAVAMPEVTSSKAILQATLRLQRAVVTKVTTRFDLTAIRPADFGDWEEPTR